VSQETPFLLSREVALTLTETRFIRIEGLHHTHQIGSHHAVAALRGIDLTIDAGEHVAIIGANGSGKSTLLRHLNALLLPTEGDAWIAGWNTRDADHLRVSRRTSPSARRTWAYPGMSCASGWSRHSPQSD